MTKEERERESRTLMTIEGRFKKPKGRTKKKVDSRYFEMENFKMNKISSSEILFSE